MQSGGVFSGYFRIQVEFDVWMHAEMYKKQTVGLKVSDLLGSTEFHCGTWESKGPSKYGCWQLIGSEVRFDKMSKDRPYDRYTLKVSLPLRAYPALFGSVKADVAVAQAERERHRSLRAEVAKAIQMDRRVNEAKRAVEEAEAEVTKWKALRVEREGLLLEREIFVEEGILRSQAAQAGAAEWDRQVGLVFDKDALQGLVEESNDKLFSLFGKK